MSEKREFDEHYAVALKGIDLPEKLAGSYEVVDCLKESEEKTIYQLADRDGQNYILKIYDIRYAVLAENENQIVKQLEEIGNVSIPSVIDSWKDEHKVYILSDYIEGMTLAELYELGRLQNEDQIIEFSLQICKLISILHRQDPPIIHRDIKPENFIWNKAEDRLYLIDCDSARLYKEGRERDTIVLGTPTHAAPEAYGYTQCDMRSDVFGIGKTIQYMCCGQSDDDALEKCEIPKDIHRIIAKCVEFSPKNRYKSVDAVEHDLRSLYECRKKSVSSRSRKRYVAILLAGMTTAFVLGNFLGRYWKFSEKNAKDTLVDGGVEMNGHEQLTSATEYEPTGTEENEGSLLNSVNQVKIDVTGYQDLIDKIVIAYYEMDLDGLGEAYDALFTRLYAADDLKALDWTDTSKLDEVPENYPFRPYPYRVCDPLACYDQILNTKIGSYKEYAGIIYGYIDYYLNEDTAHKDNPFYQYCTESNTKDTQLYKEALVEEIGCALRGVMDQDGLEFAAI